MGLASSGTSNKTRDVTCSRLFLEHRLIVNSEVELTVALALKKDHSKQYLEVLRKLLFRWLFRFRTSSTEADSPPPWLVGEI